MKLEFTHAGRTRTLAKRNEVVRLLNAGVLTAAQAAHKPWLFRLVILGKQRTFALSANDGEAVQAAKQILDDPANQPDRAASDNFADFVKGLISRTLAQEWANLEAILAQKRQLSCGAVASRLDCSTEWVKAHLKDFPTAGRMRGGEIRIPEKDIEKLAAERKINRL